MIAYIYLFVITIGLIVTYFGAGILFALLFKNELPKFSKKCLVSIPLILTVSIAGYVAALSIPDFELGNRVLHGFGGGFMAMLVCFLAVRDTGLGINKLQFFVVAGLTAMALGIANELCEFILQSSFGIIFAPHIYDTWYDLASNTIGALLGAILFTPFISRK